MGISDIAENQVCATDTCSVRLTQWKVFDVRWELNIKCWIDGQRQNGYYTGDDVYPGSLCNGDISYLMNIMFNFKLAGVIVFLLHIGCAEQRDTDLYSYDIKSELNDSTTVYPQQYEIEELFTPANTSLQSNKEGLVINPLTPASGYSLFYYQHEDLNACCSLFMIFNS